MKRRDERKMYKGKDTGSTHDYNLITVSIFFALLVYAFTSSRALCHLYISPSSSFFAPVNAGILVKIYQRRRLHTWNVHVLRDAQTVLSLAGHSDFEKRRRG